MRFLSLLLIVSNISFAHNDKSSLDVKQANNLEKVVYASIYTDELINQFDQMLDYKLISLDQGNVLHTDLYAKILSARSFIEKYNGHEIVIKNNKSSMLKIQNSKLYNDVVAAINSNALKITEEQKQMRKSINTDSIIYPSVSSAGNVTGNTFPQNVWALTFDDGPRKNSTAKVVDNLYKRNIKATFFMLTDEAKKYEREAINVVDSGMKVALHSYTHPDLNKASDDSLVYQITQAKKDLESLLNVKTSVFRLPYGSGLRNAKVRNIIAKNNYVHIFWNIDTLDWKDKNPQSILERVKKQMKLTPKKSGIILFHDIHATTVTASALTMDYLLDNGKTICTVEEVISHLNGNSEDCLK